MMRRLLSRLAPRPAYVPHIPVLGVPCMVRVDLLQKMIESIDVRVDVLLVIDNTRHGIIDPAELKINPLVGMVAVDHRGYNLGVPASWNVIMRDDEPWWAIVNDDIVFAPGDLLRLIEHMESEGGLAFLLTPSAMGITHEVVETVGAFDENFHPAYFEDNDYVYRCGLLGVTVTALPAAYHHERSATIHSDDLLLKENHRTFPLNRDYYIRKWGGIPLQEQFRTPFNRGGSPKDWELEAGRIERQTWREAEDEA